MAVGRWYDDAACADPAVDPRIFEGDRSVPQRFRWRKARAMCEGCPVRPKCLAAALDIPHLPHWQEQQVFAMFQGGLTPNELTDTYLRQTRRRAA